jgi:hypothetical protein
MNRKELFIKALCGMNLDLLDLAIEEDSEYLGISKEIFLQKVRQCFKEFKSKGDTCLKLYPGQCDSPECPNYRNKGLSFIGNTSADHLDLVIDFSDGSIADMCSCYEFKPDNEGLTIGKRNNITVYEDELLDFKPDVNFLIKAQQCVNAFEEINKHERYLLPGAKRLEWLKRYYSLFKSIPYPQMFVYRSFWDFHKCYRLLWIDFPDILRRFRKLLPEFKKAVEEIKSRQVSDLISHNEWKQKWQQLYESIPERSYFYINRGKKGKLYIYLRLDREFNFILNIDRYSTVFNFLQVYVRDYPGTKVILISE